MNPKQPSSPEEGEVREPPAPGSGEGGAQTQRLALVCSRSFVPESSPNSETPSNYPPHPSTPLKTSSFYSWRGQNSV